MSTPFSWAMNPRMEKMTVAEKNEVKVLTQQTKMASLKNGKNIHVSKYVLTTKYIFNVIDFVERKPLNSEECYFM